MLTYPGHYLTCPPGITSSGWNKHLFAHCFPVHLEYDHRYCVRELRSMEKDEETEQKQQCISCGRWFDKSEIIGEVCADCHVTVIEDEDEV